MNQTFTPFARVSLHHAYYADGYGNDLAVRPTPECAGHLRNLRLLFKPTADGFLLLAAGPANGRPAGAPAEEATAADLAFSVHALNPHFASFTDLPLVSPAGHRLYFTNAGRADGRLTEGDCTGEADLLPVAGSRFGYPVGAVGGRLTVRDEAGQPVFGAAAAGPVVPVDLSDHPEGRYAFYENETCTGHRLVLRAANPPALGFLRLRLPGGVPGTARHYTLRFAARETTWRYRIRRRWLTDAHLALVDSRGAVQFRAVPDPEYGQRFESDRRIAFRDRYDFTLKLTREPGGRPVLAALPYPSWLHLKPGEPAGAGLAAEVLVAV
ncbi:MAG TPA: hypothetical protein VF646_05905 [Cytophagales bacterium]|jgi:hypothetical protein